jgi:hypothetical protein
MIGLGVGFSERGKKLVKVNPDLKKGLEENVMNCVEIERKALLKEVPRGEKDMREIGQMHLADYLSMPNLCIRKRSKHTGYVFFNQRLVRHIKWVVIKTKSDYQIRGHPLLHFWWKNAGVWFTGPLVKHHPGSKANTFIKKAWRNSRGQIWNSTSQHIIKAIIL